MLIEDYKIRELVGYIEKFNNTSALSTKRPSITIIEISIENDIVPCYCITFLDNRTNLKHSYYIHDDFTLRDFYFYLDGINRPYLY